MYCWGLAENDEVFSTLVITAFCAPVPASRSVGPPVVEPTDEPLTKASTVPDPFETTTRLKDTLNAGVWLVEMVVRVVPS